MRRGTASAPSRSTAGARRRSWRKKLGASDYIDTATEDPAKALTAMGGARAMLATVTNAEAMQAIAGGLGVNGVMMVIGAVAPLTVNSSDLIGKSAGVRGWYSGMARDSEDMLGFSKLNKVLSMNEIYPLAKAQDAYERVLSGKARFRVVLKMDP
jgi:D-arabinose 1-dehydrogenase-like Zn-dependent alcohol dehydrogenase